MISMLRCGSGIVRKKGNWVKGTGHKRKIGLKSLFPSRHLVKESFCGSPTKSGNPTINIRHGLFQ